MRVIVDGTYLNTAIERLPCSLCLHLICINMTGVPSHNNKIATQEDEHLLGTNEILIQRTKRKQFLDLFFAVSILLNIHLT